MNSSCSGIRAKRLPERTGSLCPQDATGGCQWGGSHSLERVGLLGRGGRLNGDLLSPVPV